MRIKEMVRHQEHDWNQVRKQDYFRKIKKQRAKMLNWTESSEYIGVNEHELKLIDNERKIGKPQSLKDVAILTSLWSVLLSIARTDSKFR